MIFDFEALDIRRPEVLPFAPRSHEEPARPRYWNCDQFERRRGDAGVSAYTIAVLRRWLSSVYGMETSLLVERLGARNRVCLRLLLRGATYEAEAAWLEALRRERLGRDRAFARICQHLGLEHVA